VFVRVLDGQSTGKAFPPGSSHPLDYRGEVRDLALHIFTPFGFALGSFLNAALQIVGSITFSVRPFALPVRSGPFSICARALSGGSFFCFSHGALQRRNMRLQCVQQCAGVGRLFDGRKFRP
jgi:hypothetical protein